MLPDSRALGRDGPVASRLVAGSDTSLALQPLSGPPGSHHGPVELHGLVEHEPPAEASPIRGQSSTPNPDFWHTHDGGIDFLPPRSSSSRPGSWTGWPARSPPLNPTREELEEVYRGWSVQRHERAPCAPPGDESSSRFEVRPEARLVPDVADQLKPFHLRKEKESSGSGSPL